MKNKFAFKFFFLGIACFLCLLNISRVRAAEVEEYGSNGAVGFYGEYVFPTQLEPEPPSQPVVQVPNNHQPLNQPSKPSPIRGVLPQTGSQVAHLLIWLGCLIILFIVIIFIYKKRREINEEL